jgi:hypothetical protein
MAAMLHTLSIPGFFLDLFFQQKAIFETIATNAQN